MRRRVVFADLSTKKKRRSGREEEGGGGRKEGKKEEEEGVTRKKNRKCNAYICQNIMLVLVRSGMTRRYGQTKGAEGKQTRQRPTTPEDLLLLELNETKYRYYRCVQHNADDLLHQARTIPKAVQHLQLRFRYP